MNSKSSRLIALPWAFVAVCSLTTMNSICAGEGDGKPVSAFSDLPVGIASFGAAIDGDWLYVYGGHIGKTHTYSKEQSSARFQRINLKTGGKWENLPSGPGVQGLALLSHSGQLYRIGGMTAKNDKDEKHDLHSLPNVARFDPNTKTWTELPPLPQGRSSHGAAIIGNDLYVVGGWQLQGEKQPRWHTTALVMDLAAETPEWRELPKPPFERRAMMAAPFDGKLYVTGGLKSKGGITKEVAVFDPKSQNWSSAPEIPGFPMNGNGLAACATDKSLYISGMNGQVYRLNNEKDGWDVVGQLEQPRIHHRLLPVRHGVVLAVAGATREGHLRSVDPVKFERKH